jgi:hypothetical protein
MSVTTGVCACCAVETQMSMQATLLITSMMTSSTISHDSDGAGTATPATATAIADELGENLAARTVRSAGVTAFGSPHSLLPLLSVAKSSLPPRSTATDWLSGANPAHVHPDLAPRVQQGKARQARRTCVE